MVITWYGFSCFKIQEQTRDLEVSIITDPFTPEDGKKLPREFSADIVTVSHDHNRHNNLSAITGLPAGRQGKPFIIDGPGEYEVREAFITGVGTYHDLAEGKEKGRNTMYYVNVAGLHLLHLGDLKHPLEEKHLEEFHEIDVLFVPVGGKDVLNAKQAADVVGQIEPRIIIPMHFRTGKLGSGLDTADAFLKAMGIGKTEALPKLKLAAKDLPQEEMRVILLEAI